MPAEPPTPGLVLAERLSSQLLSGAPARDPVAVVARLLAVQGQDPRGARLAVRARSTGLRAAEVDRALSQDRSLLITTLNRGTLHLVTREDYPWLHALSAPRLFAGNARRLSEEGVSPGAAERGVAAVQHALAAQGPQTRRQLREAISAAGVRTEGQALVHLLMLVSLRGIAVRGPMVGADHAYVLVRDWLGPSAPPDRELALAELARRYLAGHGPADERDLARWAGLPLRDARFGLRAIAAELRGRQDGLLELAGVPRPAELPPPRLLGAFDPLLLGWTSRDFVVGAHRTVITVNGLFRPFALVRGRASATWRLVGGRVSIEPFGKLSQSDAAGLEADAREVVRYLGL